MFDYNPTGIIASPQLIEQLTKEVKQLLEPRANIFEDKPKTFEMYSEEQTERFKQLRSQPAKS